MTVGPGVAPARWCGLEGVDLVEQVAVPVKEAAVDAGAGDAGCADLGAVGGGAAQYGDDTLPPVRT